MLNNRKRIFIVNEIRLLIEPEIRMQSRKLRMKNIGYMGCFLVWYIGAMGFIMYRLKGDDLETLEKDAKERIEMTKINKH